MREKWIPTISHTEGYLILHIIIFDMQGPRHIGSLGSSGCKEYKEQDPEKASPYQVAL
jgi:hypothetical protein